VKGVPRAFTSRSSKFRFSPLKSWVRVAPHPIVDSGLSWTIHSFCWWSTIQSLLCFRWWVWFSAIVHSLAYEELGVSVPFFKIGDPKALLFSCPFKHHQTNKLWFWHDLRSIHRWRDFLALTQC
jgi:hypothetical protein